MSLPGFPKSDGCPHGSGTLLDEVDWTLLGDKVVTERWRCFGCGKVGRSRTFTITADKIQDMENARMAAAEGRI